MKKVDNQKITTEHHHGGGTRSDHPQQQTSAEATFFLVPDPSALHASFGGWDLITIFDLCLLFGPYLVTMMTTLLCLSQLVHLIPIVSTFLVTYQWALFAPALLWIMILVAPHWLKPYPDPNFHRTPRWQRRLMQRHCNHFDKKNHSTNRQHSSQIYHKVHRRYPISWCSMGQYLRHTPTVYEQDLATQIDALRVRVVSLDREFAHISRLHTLNSCYPAPVSAGREGEHGMAKKQKKMMLMSPTKQGLLVQQTSTIRA